MTASSTKQFYSERGHPLIARWRGLLGFALVFFTPLLSVASAVDQESTNGAEQYGLIVVKDVMVPMRDGVKLATDLYLPASNGAIAQGKFPVLVVRTPYGKNPPAARPNELPVEEKELDAASNFAKHGYVVVVQDVRGRFGSEGKFDFAVNEGPDGYDTVEWAAAQPWSDGNVGSYGASYLAHVQNAMAVLRPPHLRTMFITVGAGNYYEEGAWRGGAFMLLHNVFYGLTAIAGGSKEARADPVALSALQRAAHQDLGSWMLAYPYRPYATPFAPVPDYQRWFQDYVDHYSYDDYWKRNGYDADISYDKYPDIPIYFTTGWYDFFERGSLHNWQGLAARHKSPTKLLIGPWTHGAVGPRFSGDVDFGARAEFDMFNEQLRWFDQILKHRDTGVMKDPLVNMFIMGGGDGLRTQKGRMEDGGQWVSAAAWPPKQETSKAFYLHGDSTLSEQAPAKESASVYEFDPLHPVPTIGGQMNPGGDAAFPADGPRDQHCSTTFFECGNNLPLSTRRDILVFQTPPLDSDVVIAGPVTVDLWISSSAPDTDFTAKLVDVAPPNKDYPSGYAMNLEDRIIRVRWSEGQQKPVFLKPGEVRKVTIDLLGVGNRFAKGHRIRLDISSSNFPYFDVNPNTGETPGSHTHMVTAINTVYHDESHPSHINLPILP
jgi:hypothetical protein